jgi:hypothetical protein
MHLEKSPLIEAKATLTLSRHGNPNPNPNPNHNHNPKHNPNPNLRLYGHESSKVQDLFRSIPETTLRQTCREMRYLKVTGNSVVISEGMHKIFFPVMRFPDEISFLDFLSRFSCFLSTYVKGMFGDLAYIIISGIA